MIVGWPAYEAWRDEYAKIADPARYPVEWIDTQVATDAFGAFANVKAGMLAKVDTYPTGLKEVHCVAAAGDLAGILALAPAVEEWGRLQGCVAAIVESREGWRRVLEFHGYRLTQTKLKKDF